MDFMEQLIDAVSDLQAAGIANATIIEAIMISHPDPEALRRAWHDISSPRLAAISLSNVSRDGQRPVDRYTVERLTTWGEKLDRYFPRPESRRE